MTRNKKQPLKKAVAVKYQQEKHSAPVVTAKGYGSIAEKIIDIADKNGIYIHEDADMVEVLSKVDVGEQIPEHLYKAIAEILAFVYRLNQKMSSGHETKTHTDH